MMPTKSTPRQIALPRCWNKAVKSAVLHAIALANYAIVQARGKAVQENPAGMKSQVDNDRLLQEVSLTAEEMRIKDTRMADLPSQRRPHYRPTERLAILELRAIRGWSLEQTAERFFVIEATISSWQQRVDENGPNALVQLPKPVNKFPELVSQLVRRLKILCPTLGKRKIAEMLARSGLHLATTTVGRMLRQPPDEEPSVSSSSATAAAASAVVTAKRPHHVWHVDLTVAPIVSGFWTTWCPFALPQCWPFCWWVAVVIDHYSRRMLGSTAFSKQPTCEQVRAFLGRTMHQVGAVPKYIVCDRGSQFDCDGFRGWCRRRGIRPRFGAVGQHGSIAVVERFIRTLKESCTRRLLVTPLVRKRFQRELSLFGEWYNTFRPHMTLGGRTPDEVYDHRFPDNRRPRHEPRSRWPRGAPSAKPWALARNGPGTPLELEVTFHAGRKHLPVVTLRRAA